MTYQKLSREPVAAERVTTRGPASQSGLPRRGAQPNAPFELKHHPNRWAFNEALGFHPIMGYFHHEPGLGGVDGKGDLSAAEAQLLRNGWTIIPQQARELLGGEFPELELDVHGQRWRASEGYLRKYKVQGGGYIHVMFYQRPHVIVDRVAWVTDHKAQIAFNRALVERRLCYPMDPLVKETLVSKREHAVQRLEHDVSRNPGNDLLKARLMNERRILGIMRDEDTSVADGEVQGFLAKLDAQQDAARRQALGARLPSEMDATAPADGAGEPASRKPQVRVKGKAG